MDEEVEEEEVGVELETVVQDVHIPTKTAALSPIHAEDRTRSSNVLIPERTKNKTVVKEGPLGDLENYLIPLISKLNLSEEEVFNNKLSTIQSQILTYGFRIPKGGIHDLLAIEFYEKVLCYTTSNTR